MGMDPKQAAIMAVIELETKLHFDGDHDGAHTLTQTDCDSARASVFAAGHLLPSIAHSTLLFHIERAGRWLAGRGTQG
ncbi:hypothetical protein SAMN05192563_1024109 [Paraburkholderia aspalathi]|uniref:Uncharacterized protein n=2 Tax=Paraburkholderia aspalathi TaxID=1324617 RepID=A0A1I7EJE6_9BURK|nr:hypothetical protein SAMN05192563_1024109 [Paraburkholderia aspalathi]